jgi:thioredoxin-like negative regulator of GroEL
MRTDAARIGVMLTDQNFQTMVLESLHLVLVACWAERCGLWQMLAPEIAALAEAFRGQAAVATLDVEAEPSHRSAMGFRPSPPCCFLRTGRSSTSSPGWWPRQIWPRSSTP